VNLIAAPFARAARAPPSSAADPTRRPAADIAALALHLMTNTALTSATLEVDGGQQPGA